MAIHPRILDRARKNFAVKSADVLLRRDLAVEKLDYVLAFLRSGNPTSNFVAVDDLIDEVNDIRRCLKAPQDRSTDLVAAGATISRRMRLLHSIIMYMREEEGFDKEKQSQPKGQ